MEGFLYRSMCFHHNDHMAHVSTPRSDALDESHTSGQTKPKLSTFPVGGKRSKPGENVGHPVEH